MFFSQTTCVGIIPALRYCSPDTAVHVLGRTCKQPKNFVPITGCRATINELPLVVERASDNLHSETLTGIPLYGFIQGPQTCGVPRTHECLTPPLHM